jgi:predicted NBD/HSP70 family sugar kinase
MPQDAPIRQRSLRTHNLGLVLRHVAASDRAISRADVAAATGLTRATVSTLVDELIAGELLTEVDPAPRAGAGRPGVGLRLSTQGPAGLGLEINVDYVAARLVDLSGAARHTDLRRVDQRGRDPNKVLADVADLALTAIAAAKGSGLVLAGTALAVPGLVADGVVRLAPNLGWRDVDVRPALARLGPLSVDNEANLAALGELDAWPEPGPASFLYVSGEIGVGAGIVLDGTLFRGSRGYGGELGHVTISPDGPACRCGAYGCLEAYANQDALLVAAGLAGGEVGGGAVARGVTGGDVATLAARAQDGDPAALAALDGAGRAIGVAAADVVNLLDVDTVVLGGIYAPLTPWLSGPVEREVARRSLASSWAPVRVRASALGASATVVGAAGSVIRAIRDAPAVWLEAVRA